MEELTRTKGFLRAKYQTTTMNLSVIIYTRNRAESLRKTLRSIVNMSIMPSIQWELIVIDNNSSDHTKEICKEYDKLIPLAYISAVCHGKGCALNVAAHYAKGDLLAFSDDDVEVDSKWVNKMIEGAGQYHEASYFGGPVTPKWESPPPDWFALHASSLLESFSVRERNSSCDFLRNDEVPFVGANMMFRRTIFDAGFCFCEDLFQGGKELSRVDDIILMRGIKRAGFQGAYLPFARIYRRIQGAQITEKAIRLWHVEAGIISIRLGQVIPTQHIWFGAARYLWRNLLTSGVQYLLSRWTQPSGKWLKAEINMAITLGMITELRRDALTRKRNSLLRLNYK